jgi:sugar lactone lactonase YvrE
MNPQIFWTLPGLTDILARANADGTEQATLLDSTQLNNPNSIALDLDNGHIYIADSGAGDRILRTNLDGSDLQVIVPNAGDNPEDIALDLVNGYLYWTVPGTTDEVRRANLDGANVETILDATTLNNPNGLALDIQNGHIYIADSGAGDRILRTNLDGSDLQVIIPDAGNNPQDIALDLVNGQIYWSLPGTTDEVRRANLDGSNIETILDTQVLENPNGLALDLDAGQIYVADSGAGDVILRANLDGSNPETLPISVGDNPSGLAIAPNAPIPPPTPLEVSVFAEPETPLSETDQTPGAFIFRLSEPAPAGGLIVNFQAGDTDPDPTSRDVTIGDPGTTNIDDFDIRPLPGFISRVTITEGATEARLVVTPFPDDLAEPDEVISLSLLSGENYIVSTENTTAELTLTDDATTDDALTVTVSVENLSPDNGTFLTPLWFGFHNGSFDTYDRGRPVSPGLESLAEDGATDLISQEFDLAGFGTVQGTILGPDGTPGPIDPGETATFTVQLDPTDPNSRFFNYASMIIPSNDFFIANGNEQAHPILDEDGNFIGADFIVFGTNVLDAGSEVNDEIPANTAFFGQMAPNTGVTENGVVQLAEGFIPDGPILSSDDFSNADFTAADFQVARIRVLAGEPEPPVGDAVDLNAIVSGLQEVPTFTGSGATGVSSLSLNEAGDALSYSLTLTGLDFGDLLGTGPQTADDGDDVTRIHIHAGARGENGPVALGLFDLVAAEADGQDADDFSVVENPDGSVTLSGVWEPTDAASLPLSDFVSAIQAAESGEDLDLYWNIHTERFPGGEIRGQIQAGEAPEADPVRLTVAVKNLAPPQGAIVTPFWFGLHDGSFNTFDLGAPASPAIELVAEEGFIGLEGLDPDYPSYAGTPFDGIDLANLPILPLTIASQFANSPAGERGLQGIAVPEDNPLGIAPGETGTDSLTVYDPLSSRYFSYGAMVFPATMPLWVMSTPSSCLTRRANLSGPTS